VGVVVLGAVLARSDAHRLRGDVVWSALGLTNWHLLAGGNSYFGGLGRPPLVRHLWSLAVEIQFYALLPLLVAWLVRQSRPRALKWVAGAVGASSLLMAVLYQPGDPSRAYYGTDTRVGALLSGALLALALRRAPAPRARPARWGPVAGGVALATLVALLVFADETSRLLYPLGFLAVRVATALVIVSASAPGRLARLFEARLPQWLGLRSYSLYLWHWPFLALARPGIDVGWPRWLATGLALTAGLVAGHLSFRFVEMRRPRPRRPRAAGGGLDRLLAAARWANVGIALAATAALLANLPTVDPLARNLRVGQQALAAQRLPAVPRPTTTVPRPATTVPPTTAAPTPETVPPPDTTAVPPPAAPPTEAPLPAGPPPGTVPVTAVGDSVMVSAAPALQERLGATGYIDARLSRQFSEGVEVARLLREQGALGQVVIVHLGTNGPPKAGQVDALMAELAGVPHVRLVTVRMPQRWEAEANQTLRDAAARHPTVQIVDWYAYSEGHREWFESDGTHVKRSGAEAYADLLMSSVPAPAPPTPPTTVAPAPPEPAVELPLPTLPVRVIAPRRPTPV
ncbi:MAG TPA: acyltransferase family protein, partial [Acidimicrobiales bacterium]|nr:acyltransferase family protein [Acidimicrobiales bacterium]